MVNNIILASILVLVWPMLKLTGVHNGAHIYMVYMILRQIEGADGHIGYAWNPAHLFPVGQSITTFIMPNSKAITRGFYRIWISI